MCLFAATASQLSAGDVCSTTKASKGRGRAFTSRASDSHPAVSKAGAAPPLRPGGTRHERL
ncbi:hypothetical protein SBC2_09820 [Caballeronia sp. SBC2]|nr:hypothetical protein SBC2_09820 [Caballeronia sp. SBC2]